jgi:hypothetical protein
MVHGVTRQSVFSLLRPALPMVAAFVLLYPTIASADPAAVAQVVVNVLNRFVFGAPYIIALIAASAAG